MRKKLLLKLIEEHEAALRQIGGCGDGYCCVTGKAKGQHTNGGCRCWKDDMRMQLAMRRHRIFIERLAAEEAASK